MRVDTGDVKVESGCRRCDSWKWLFEELKWRVDVAGLKVVS